MSECVCEGEEARRQFLGNVSVGSGQEEGTKWNTI